MGGDGQGVSGVQRGEGGRWGGGGGGGGRFCGLRRFRRVYRAVGQGCFVFEVVAGSEGTMWGQEPCSW